MWLTVNVTAQFQISVGKTERTNKRKIGRGDKMAGNIPKGREKSPKRREKSQKGRKNPKKAGKEPKRAGKPKQQEYTEMAHKNQNSRHHVLTANIRQQQQQREAVLTYSIIQSQAVIFPYISLVAFRQRVKVPGYTSTTAYVLLVWFPIRFW